MSYYETVLDTPEMQRVRENQKNFSLVSLCSTKAQPNGGIRQAKAGVALGTHTWYPVRAEGCTWNLLQAHLVFKSQVSMKVSLLSRWPCVIEYKLSPSFNQFFKLVDRSF